MSILTRTCRTWSGTDDIDSLQNYYMSCPASEKMLQLTRIIRHEVETQQSSRFIVYFATCACVDYFYRVRPTCFLLRLTLMTLITPYLT